MNVNQISTKKDVFEEKVFTENDAMLTLPSINQKGGYRIKNIEKEVIFDQKLGANLGLQAEV